MKVIVGLGNPGKKYEGTRHNAGAMLMDSIYDLRFKNYEWKKTKGIYTVGDQYLILVKSSEYFMNESGKMVESLKRLSELNVLSDLYVAHDDLDLKLGEYKIQFGKGPEVHGGINDIERVIGKDFWRIRIGVDNRGTPRTPGEEYVLQRFLDDEVNKLESVIDEIVKGFN